MNKIKNIAIIAHVDHGKTTLVDALLKQAGTFGEHEKVDERIMDSNDLEKERGITIFSKNASFHYDGYKINIVDTPGHADFGGEVQRILKMVDSVLLLVDAFEGVMPQTKYVLKQALEHGLRPIVVVNKIDRSNSDPDAVVDSVFDLFVDLGANDIQLDFPVVYASAKNGFAKLELEDEDKDMKPLYDKIMEHVEDPEGDVNEPLQMLVTNTEYDEYVGKLGTGRIYNGKIEKNQEITLIKRNGDLINGKVTRIYGYDGLKKVEMEAAFAGDIVTIGSSSGTVEKIGGRTTVIRDAEGNVHYIPNSNITLVINKTMGWSMARFTLDVEPDTDINLLTEIINKVGAELAEDPDFVKKIQSPPKFDGIIGITGNSIKIVINGKTLPSDQWSVSGEMRRRVVKAFRKNGIKLAVLPTFNSCK